MSTPTAGVPADERAAALPIACLLSDCDGVIVDSEVVADDAMRDVLQQAFDVPDIAPLLDGLVGRRVIDIIRIIEGQLGQTLGDARRVELQQAIDARVAEAAPPMPGTLDTYRALGLPVAVVSNSASARLRRSVERAGVQELAGPHIYSAEDVGRPKPAPDAYLYAARQLGHPPAACLVIEDSVTGIRAARAAGMRVLAFLGGSHHGEHGEALLRAAEPDALFTRMDELPGLIARMNAGAR